MFSMITTTRVHMNPKEALGSLAHNIDRDFRAKEAHIDGNSDNFEIWKNVGVYNAYKEVFGDVIKEYNEKQKRKDRKILDANGDEVGGYIQNIQTGRRGKKERVVYKNMPDGTKEAVGKRQESQGQRVLYELVCSAGNCEKELDENGKILYTDDGHESHLMRLPYHVNRAACRELTERFEELYPHFKMVCAAWHGDEFYLNAKGVAQSGIEHVHINFIPWADGYKRGLPIQASMSKALEQMGFTNGMDGNGVWHNAYYYWTQDVQEKFESILQEKYAEYMKSKIKDNSLSPMPEDSWTLTFAHPAKGKNLRNLDPAEYRELKDVGRQVNMARKELDSVQDEIVIRRHALEQAEAVIAEAGETKKAIDDYAAAKQEEAERYYLARKEEAEQHYLARKEEADALLREAEEKYRERVQEAELRFGDIVKAYKKISGDLEFYKKRCAEVLKKPMSLDIPIPALERWMKKRKMEKNGMRVSVYDACMEEISTVLKRRAKEQRESADTLNIEVRRQLEIAEESLEDDNDNEDNTGYGFAI